MTSIPRSSLAPPKLGVCKQSTQANNILNILFHQSSQIRPLLLLIPPHSLATPTTKLNQIRSNSSICLVETLLSLRSFSRVRRRILSSTLTTLSRYKSGRETGPSHLHRYLLPRPIALFKPMGSPKILSWDSRAPLESTVLTWRNETGRERFQDLRHSQVRGPL